MADDPTPSRVDFSALASVAAPYFEEEGLFARDVDGQLIRVRKATADDFDQTVKLTIDGREVTVKKAVPQRDSQGNLIRDAHGNPTPRFTTIFDAAQEIFVKHPGDRNPIPTLCHREHLPPVGVCRVCMVEAAETTGRGRRAELVPACLQRVSEGMEVHTLESQADPAAASRVRAAAAMIVELLASDHLPEQDGRLISPAEAGPGNELAALADRLGIRGSRFARASKTRGTDHSSVMIAVDHDQCILCGRCNRGCNWLKANNVIGRSGKGYLTHIAFDLDQPMGSSSCVSCGECAISCPTGALEFTSTFIESRETEVDDGLVSAEELHRLPLFSGIPFKFLQFNGDAIVRRRLKAGDVLCREGDYGNTAFILNSGRFEAFISNTRGAVRNQAARGWLGFLKGFRTIAEKLGGAARLTDIGGAELNEGQRIEVSSEDLILGEMSCMNRYPRSATVVALEDAEVFEIRRNVLHMLQRNAVSREILDHVYRSRALAGRLQNLPLFQTLDSATRQQAVEFLKDRAELTSVQPGQVIIAQGDRAQNFFVIKLGFVKVSQKVGREDRVLDYLGPGRYFGEIGLLSQMTELLNDPSLAGAEAGICCATCSALDHVELVRIRGQDFRELLRAFPQLVPAMVEKAGEVLRQNNELRNRLESCSSQDFLDQGLYLAQSLLVLDLERCTRCDECTKACADTHGGVTRLIRDGMRFDRFLVASSCRSCMDPYCLIGCPVDAIHRRGDTLEISIEDYCIGCGLCAQNCPYGNINMHGFPKMERDARTGREQPVFQILDGKRHPVLQQRATTCDLCQSIDGRPSCVYACPHNAAFRLSGEELARLVGAE